MCGGGAFCFRARVRVCLCVYMSSVWCVRFGRYTKGINSYLDSDPELPLEFKLLGVTPEPWVYIYIYRVLCACER